MLVPTTVWLCFASIATLLTLIGTFLFNRKEINIAKNLYIAISAIFLIFWLIAMGNMDKKDDFCNKEQSEILQ